jgi:hypothetical protein
MRTTVTLDPDVERLLKQAAHKRGESFKVILNNAVRQAFQNKSSPAKRKPFVVDASPMGLHPGLDPSRMSELADEMEIDAHLETTRRLMKEMAK